MPKITNKGTRDRMVADRILKPGESRDVTEKQAEQLASDEDLRIEAAQAPLSPSTATSPQIEEHDLWEEEPVVEVAPVAKKSKRKSKKK